MMFFIVSVFKKKYNVSDVLKKNEGWKVLRNEV